MVVRGRSRESTELIWNWRRGGWLSGRRERTKYSAWTSNSSICTRRRMMEEHRCHFRARIYKCLPTFPGRFSALLLVSVPLHFFRQLAPLSPSLTCYFEFQDCVYHQHPNLPTYSIIFISLLVLLISAPSHQQIIQTPASLLPTLPSLHLAPGHRRRRAPNTRTRLLLRQLAQRRSLSRRSRLLDTRACRIPNRAKRIATLRCGFGRWRAGRTAGLCGCGCGCQDGGEVVWL
jgi:hypothetical protein